MQCFWKWKPHAAFSRNDLIMYIWLCAYSWKWWFTAKKIKCGDDTKIAFSLQFFQKFKSFATTKWGYWWQKIFYIQNRKTKQLIISKNGKRKMFLPPSKVFYPLHVLIWKQKIQKIWIFWHSTSFNDQLEGVKNFWGGKKLLLTC